MLVFSILRQPYRIFLLLAVGWPGGLAFEEKSWLLSSAKKPNGS
jgi:hypothetical protein